jgi:ABC-type oligopeptide transport system substrate-binding subunit
LHEEKLTKAKLTLRLAALVFVAAVAGGCGRQQTRVIEKPATVVVTVAVPVEVPVTRVATSVVTVAPVVVTATPVPTPAYVSRTDVAPGTLAYPLPGEPQALDPQEASDDASQLLIAQLYEGLFGLNDSGAAVPAAAQGYERSGDGKTYTITLRARLEWSDGEPVTAQQYVAGFCRSLDPAMGNDQARQAAEQARISGAAPYTRGAAGDCATVGVTAPDTVTLRITLDRPTALPELLAYPAWYPAPRSADGSPSATDAPPIGNGPYVMAKRRAGEPVVLTRNAHYWGANEVSIERIELPVVAEPAHQLAAYEQGGLQVAEVPIEALPRIQAQAAYSAELHVVGRPGISFLGINTRSGPIAEVNFRRALASAVDRGTLLDKVLGEPWHAPASSLLPPGVQGHAPDGASAGYPYDPKAARTYLAQAGYGPDNPPPPVDIWTNREGHNLVLMQGVAGMLEQAGIPTRLVSSNWDVYQAELEACKATQGTQTSASADKCGYGLYWAGWVMENGDPAGLLSLAPTAGSPLVYSGWQEDSYADLLTRTTTEGQAAGRAALYQGAGKMLLDQAVVIPLLYYDRLVVVKAGVGFAYPAFGPPQFARWRLP